MLVGTKSHVAEVLKHLYISPLEACNLCCKMCYTSKTGSWLSRAEILDFVERYARETLLSTITFCGGEVFIIPDFVQLINALTKNYFIQIITNGTINRLAKINNPNMVNMIVSIDGLPEYHDFNRGMGMWSTSINYMKQAKSLGFHLEVFSIVTKESMDQIGAFEDRLATELGAEVPVTYHPRKTMAYLNNHPISNRIGQTDNASFLTAKDRRTLGGNYRIFPALGLGCYQISLMSDRNVYGCCEGIRPLGRINDEIHPMIETFKRRITGPGLGCVEPGFVCGLEEYVA